MRLAISGLTPNSAGILIGRSLDTEDTRDADVQREHHRDAPKRTCPKPRQEDLGEALLMHWPGTSSLPEADDTCFCCLIQPGCDLIKVTVPGLFPAQCLGLCLHSQVGGARDHAMRICQRKTETARV